MSFVFVGLHVFIYFTLSPYGKSSFGAAVLKLLVNIFPKRKQKKHKNIGENKERKNFMRNNNEPKKIA